MTVARLRTERLLLRPLGERDVPACAAAMQDRAVSGWLSAVPWPYREKDARWFVGECAAGRETAWAIDAGNGLCGVIGLGDELGYWIARPAWGRGFASEAARAVVDHHFATGAEELRSSHHAGNDRSRHVLEKLGFVETGIAPLYLKASDRTVRSHKMLLTRRAWEGPRA